MNERIGNRYVPGTKILRVSSGEIYSGRDLSLNRDVYLYMTQNGEGSFAPAHLQTLREEWSRYDDDRFMHLLDAGWDQGTFYAVLPAANGQPLLLQLKRINWTAREILSQIYELGRAMQDAMEKGAVRFSVTADNVWLHGKTMKFVNYWSEGNETEQGVTGLCGLLYQLCTRSSAIPSELQAFSLHLYASLHDLPVKQRDAVLSVVRQGRAGELTLSSFLFGLHDLLREFDRQAEPERQAPVRGHRRFADDAVRAPLAYQTANESGNANERKAAVETGNAAEGNAAAGTGKVPGRNTAIGTRTGSEHTKNGRTVLNIILFAGIFVISFALVIGLILHIPRENGPFAPPDDSPLENSGTQAAAEGSGSQESEDMRPQENTGQQEVAAPADPDRQPGKDRRQENRPEGNDEETGPYDPEAEKQADPGEDPSDQATVSVPRLIGLNREEAEQLALAHGLRYSYFLENDERPQGTVFKQEPAPDQIVPKGSRVTFWVSR